MISRSIISPGDCIGPAVLPTSTLQSSGVFLSKKDQVVSHNPGWKIPKWVCMDPNISWREKCVLAIVCNLDEQPLHCISSNRYIANELGTSIESVKQTLIKLRKAGLLEKSTWKFRQKNPGPRCIPIPRRNENTPSEEQKHTIAGTKTHTDTIDSIDIQRERPEPCLKLSEPWKTQIVKATQARSPTFTEQRCRENLEALIVEKTLSGEVSEIRDWVEYLANRLLLEDRRIGLAVKKNTYSAPPARHESQFGTCH